MAIDSAMVKPEMADSLPVVEEEQQPAAMSDEEFLKMSRKVFEALPDHGDYSPSTRSLMTKEFYAATVRGFDAPGNYPGGLGDEEDLYYWYLGNDESCAGGIVGMEILERSDDKAKVKIVYDNCGREDHTLYLVNENGTWVASDFDNMLGMFRKFNRQISREYAGDGPEKLLRDAGVDPDEDYAVEFLREVNRYKKKYHIK